MLSSILVVPIGIPTNSAEGVPAPTSLPTLVVSVSLIVAVLTAVR